MGKIALVRFATVAWLAMTVAACAPSSESEAWQRAMATVVAQSDPLFVDQSAVSGEWVSVLQEARPSMVASGYAPACAALLARGMTERILADARLLADQRPLFVKHLAAVADWRKQARQWREATIAAIPGVQKCAECAPQLEWLERLVNALVLIDLHLRGMTVPIEEAVEQTDSASRNMRIAYVIAIGLRDGAEQPPIQALPDGPLREAIAGTAEGLSASVDAWNDTMERSISAFDYVESWQELREHHVAVLRDCNPQE